MVSILEVEISVFVETLTDPSLTQKQSKLVHFGPKMAQNNDLSDKILLTLVYSCLSPPKIPAKRIFTYWQMGF